MNLRRLGVALLMAAAIGCNTMNESAPAVGELAQAVQDGELDTDNKFSGVVYLRPLNPTSEDPLPSYSCTGVLVAPRWVLSARHCFERDGNAAIKADYAVGFGPDSNMRTPEGPIAVHTQAISGDVLIHPSFLRLAPEPHDEVSMLDSSQTARDVALLRLDAAVPISVAKHHPIGSIGSTPLCSFDDPGIGTNVGYGATGYTGSPITPINNGKRNVVRDGDWDESTEGGCSGNACAARWVLDGFHGRTGEGRPGDSGGPLFMGSVADSVTPGRVCGVASGYTPLSPLTTRTIYANLQRGNTRDFVRSTLINPRTNRVEGDCFVNPLTDPDHDGIENSVGCDNCPRNFNPNQEDSDDDDVGDACDNCVGEPNRLQRNSNAFGQKDSAGLAESLMREPPLIPTDNANTAAWKNLYPGDVCNPHPFTAIEPTTRSATNSSTRTFSQTVRLKCPGVGDSLETNSATPAQANNVILAQSISVAEVFGTTRMAICKCSAGLTDSQCFSQCGRGGVTSLPSGTQWVPATLEEGGVQITNDFVSPNPDLYGLFSSDFPVPPTRVVGDTTPLTPPSNRRLGWRYWSDLSSLSAVALGESTIAKPMVWSWLRNFGATRPLRTAVPTSPGVLRRQDLYRFELKETADAQITTWCDSAFAGVLPRFPQYFPTLDNCHMCGRVATIKGLDPEYDSVPKYVAPHYGVRSLEEVADASVIAYLNDDVGFVVPTDERDVGDTILGAVYKLNDHEILGFISRDGGKFTIREANLPAVGLFSSFGAGVAMSARRNEIMFFDAPSPLDPSKLAVRALHPDTMTEERAEPIAVGPGLAGPVVSAAYRSLDDAYYLLSRGGGHVRLHRLSKSLALQVVVEFPDGEWATHADVAVSSQGVVAVTSRDAASFNAVALGVSTDLVVAPLSWISGAEPLGLGAMPTPEGFMLERAGRPDATVYPFADGTAPGLTYHSVESAGWIDIFQ